MSFTDLSFMGMGKGEYVDELLAINPSYSSMLANINTAGSSYTTKYSFAFKSGSESHILSAVASGSKVQYTSLNSPLMMGKIKVTIHKDYEREYIDTDGDGTNNKFKFIIPCVAWVPPTHPGNSSTNTVKDKLKLLPLSPTLTAGSFSNDTTTTGTWKWTSSTAGVGTPTTLNLTPNASDSKKLEATVPRLPMRGKESG